MTVSNDIALRFSDRLYIDIALNEDGTDLDGAFILENEIIISLFSNKRTANNDEIPNAEGWAGDALDMRRPGDPLIGSKLWIFEKAKRTANRLIEAEDFTREALQWMIDDLIVASFLVETRYDDRFKTTIFIDIESTMPTGENLRFQFAWDQITNELSKRNV